MCNLSLKGKLVGSNLNKLQFNLPQNQLYYIIENMNYYGRNIVDCRLNCRIIFS